MDRRVNVHRMTAAAAFSERVSVLGQRGTAFARESLRHPAWAYFRALARIEERLRRTPRTLLDAGTFPRVDLETALTKLGVDAGLIEEGHAYLDARGETASAIPSVFDASPALRLLSYCLVRKRQPAHVVEVGVARGATTTAILAALERNGRGHLTSVELPSLAPRHREQAGILVPDALRPRWRLVLGPSQIALGSLAQYGAPPGVFVHDGSHAYHVQRGDLRKAVRHLAHDAIVVMDDVGSDAFLEVLRTDHDITLVDQGKQDPLGIAVRRAR